MFSSIGDDNLMGKSKNRSQAGRGKSQVKFRGGEIHSKKQLGRAICSETAAEEKGTRWKLSFQSKALLSPEDLSYPKQSLKGETDLSYFRFSVPGTEVSYSIIMVIVFV